MKRDKPVQHGLPPGVSIADVHGKPATRVVVYAGRMSKEDKRSCVAAAVRTYKADRIAYKGTATRLCKERRAAMKPGPVILRPELARKMNAALGVQS
jgi:hypothetical protein